MSAMTARKKTLMTVEEFERIPEEEGYRIELVRGMLIREREPGPHPLHARLQSRMAYLLESWMAQRGERGAVMTNGAFVLAVDPGTVRIPDVAYVSRERIPEQGYGRGIWRLGPDLVVEVTSPSNSWTEIQARVSDYLGAGSRLVWVVDPPTRTVTVYRPDAGADRLGGDVELEGGEVVAGFRVRLAEYFDL